MEKSGMLSNKSHAFLGLKFDHIWQEISGLNSRGLYLPEFSIFLLGWNFDHTRLVDDAS